jgi:curved DNA-binding protein CbpA
MKFDSPIFDRIRVKPDHDRLAKAELPPCQWEGCANGATHRAPKGRGKEGEQWRFCLDHVREYNHSYNYFSGMSDNDVASYQKDALTGHRPTWRMGMNGARTQRPDRLGARDPFNLFAEAGAAGAPSEKRDRPIHNAERKAFNVLGLDITAGRADIKAKFKALVKVHHPDANGGDRSTEDRLVEIIQAYNYLKGTGFA